MSSHLDASNLKVAGRDSMCFLEVTAQPEHT